MTRRYDSSTVPLQGGYVAKLCPVRAQNDVLTPAEPLPTPPFLERLFHGGREFEDQILADLTAEAPAVTRVEGHGEELEAATRAAMEAGASIIVNGRLPHDVAGRRVGRPDILVTDGRGGYRPVDVKYHLATNPEPPTRYGFPAILSSLSAPSFEAAETAPDLSARKNEGDLLQLAHYQRMLEAVGLNSEDGCWGGIIGVDRLVVWYDLNSPVWRTPSISEGSKLRSTMERYDFEFDFRLDVIAVAEEHRQDPRRPLLVLPVKIGECSSCPWWDYCRPQLEAGWGDVSLLPRVGYAEWRVHRNHGVTNRAELASLDSRTARLVATGVDVKGLAVRLSGVAEHTRLDAFGNEVLAPARVAALEVEHVTTVGELRGLDWRTAAYSDEPMGSLPRQIDLARAALGPSPVYRLRGVARAVAPGADVEVDVDMENVETGCYLWGALLSDHSGMNRPGPEYRAFATWEPMTPEVETANSLAFWRWLMRVRRAAFDRGLTFRAYCYNANAENQYLRRMGLAAGFEEDLEGFIASDQWVDLLRIWDAQLITGRSSGLKLVAPVAGHRWEIEDPSGKESMLRYDVAVGLGPEALAAREWLLAYNRGDVEATRQIREWLDEEGGRIPSIESLDPWPVPPAIV